MFFTLLLLCLPCLGAFALSYLYDRHSPALVRLAGAVPIAIALQCLVGYGLALLGGLHGWTWWLSGLLCALPCALWLRRSARAQLGLDWRGTVQSLRHMLLDFAPWRLLVVMAYAMLVLLLAAFFSRVLLPTQGGWGTGNLHNYGDMPFHLLVINSFVHGQNFPPDNPIYANAAFTYSFMVDYGVAMMQSADMTVGSALFAQNMLLVCALMALLARFTHQLSASKAAAAIAPLLLLFSGGYGFIEYAGHAQASGAGLWGTLMALQNDYTIRPGGFWRWGNSLIALFGTQRSFLLGMPLVLLVMTHLWEMFAAQRKPALATALSTDSRVQVSGLLPMAIVGLLAGMLPLVHAHSFAVLMGCAGLWALMSWRAWRSWAVFFAATAVVAIPELLMATRGSATKAQSFLGWQWGWDKGDSHIAWFWLLNAGSFIPLLLVAIAVCAVLAWRQRLTKHVHTSEQAVSTAHTSTSTQALQPAAWLLFSLPFLACFIAPNVVRLAPWVWDNIKVLVYWYLGSIPLVAWLLVQLWQRSKLTRLAVPVLLVSLTLSGALDVWRIASGQIENQFTSADTLALAAQLREKTPARALLVTAPNIGSVAVATGQRWFLGYPGHVWSHGIEPGERETIVRKIYAGDADAASLIAQHGIDYVVISPLERSYTPVNDAFFASYPTVAQTAESRVVQVRTKP
jgi:hypothetical protein